jgi:predicted PurR-regulated permease PerM
MHLADKAEAMGLSTDDLNAVSVKLLNHTLSMTAGFMGLILNGILTLFLAAYFIIEADIIWPAILKWLPHTMRERFKPLIVPLSKRMGGYVRGQLLVALGAGIFLFVGFRLIGVDYALLLGILAATLNLVPYVGSMIAVACALVVAFNQTPIMAAAVLVLYIIEQWVESSFMVPIFLGSNVSLHPLIVLLAILFGATLMGIPGALAAVPLAAAIMVFAEEFHLKKIVASAEIPLPK